MARQYNIKVSPYVWLSFIAASLLLFIPKLTLAEKDNYIVHMDLSAMPKAFSTHRSWHLATLSSVFAASKSRSSITSAATTEAKPSKLLYSYSHVINGFSAHLSPSEHEILKNSPGFISSFKDFPVKPDTTRSPSFLGLTPNSEAWKVSNYGEGIIIGVVDTGVWPESESYSDNGMPKIPKRWKGQCESGTQFNSSLCNNKLIGARFYNKAVIAKYPEVDVTMNSTRDTAGHGTHTSSTAAGNFVKGVSYFGYASGTASGVAPRAHIAMYKALWEPYSSASDVLAAIDQAIFDGVEILSISLSYGSTPLYEDPVALASFAAVQKNIVVSTSAANLGPYRGTLRNGAPWLLTVGAGTVDREFSAVLKLGNGASVTGLSLYPGNYTSRQVPIVYKQDCLDDRDLVNVAGKIIVCEGGIDEILQDQYINIRDAKNLSGGIVITDSKSLEEFLQSEFPLIFMNSKDGKKIKDYINSTTKPKASMEFKITTLGIKSAPSVAGFSSRGPYLISPAVLKPDIIAPGSLILAAWPQNVEAGRVNHGEEMFNNFNILYGTSMSCPHAAGVAALLKKAHPDWSPAAIRSAMMTTADTTTQSNGPIRENSFDENPPATPLDMGSGHINPNKALDPGLIYDVNITDYVNFLCALNLTQNQIQTITKSPHNDCSSPSLDLNYPSFLAYFNDDDDSKSNLTAIQEYHRTVTNVGDAESIYTAHLTPIDGIKVTVVPTKLVFKAKYEKLSYKLTIEGPRKIPEDVAFGYLSWVDSKGKYVVKSPVTICGINDFSVDD